MDGMTLTARLSLAIEAVEREARLTARFHPAPWRVEDASSPDPAALPAVAWLVDGEDVGVAMVNGESAARLLALSGPAATLRRCASDRRVLERHAPLGVAVVEPPPCAGCWETWPCPDVKDLAYAHQVPLIVVTS